VGEMVGKGSRKANKVQKICTHACKCKKLYLLKLLHEWGRGIKGTPGRGEFKYDIFNTL
jgi:hypothetical protein